jgi:hypothetical protein
MAQLKRLLFRGSSKSGARLLFLWQNQKPCYQTAVQYFIGSVHKQAAFPKSSLSHAESQGKDRHKFVYRNPVPRSLTQTPYKLRER